MCGIVGYVGAREATPILLGGLRRLEYRGYDSAGIAVAGALVYWALETYAETRYHLGKSSEPDKLSFREGLKFNPSYWYVVALCFTFYSGIFPFRTFAIDLFTSKYLSQMGAVASSTAAFAVAQQKAGWLNSLLPFSAMIATPLFGLLAVEIAVTMTNQGLKTGIGLFFFAVALVFVYRSFYCMRIPEEAATKA